MAGRPLRMMHTADELRHRAAVLRLAIANAMPDRYRGSKEHRDPRGVAWREAEHHAAALVRVLEELRAAVEARATAKDKDGPQNVDRAGGGQSK